jgi:hypothetical protein
MNQQIMNLFDEVCFDLIKTYFRLRIKLEKKKLLLIFVVKKKSRFIDSESGVLSDGQVIVLLFL